MGDLLIEIMIFSPCCEIKLLLRLCYASQASVYGDKMPMYTIKKVTTSSNVGASISNLGQIGNAFNGKFITEGKPSCEYPVHSGNEHVFQGGLWVGGWVDGQVAVSTGAANSVSGYAPGRSGYEFTSESELEEHSSLSGSPFFSPDAQSHQDFESVFTDTSMVVRTDSNEYPIADHLTPLGLEVHFQAFNWNLFSFNHSVILNFRIAHVGSLPIDSLYIEYWLDAVVRNVNVTPPGGTPFYNKGGNGYIDSLNMGYEFDVAGDTGFTDSYIGLKYLGSELNGDCYTSSNFEVRFQSWEWGNFADPIFFSTFHRCPKIPKDGYRAGRIIELVHDSIHPQTSH